MGMTVSAFLVGRAQAAERLRDLGMVLLIALGSRALLLLLAAATRFGTDEGGRLGTDDFLQFLIGWDSGWYLRIVANGYAPFSLEDAQMSTTPHAFFPVYPMLVRSLAFVTGLDPKVAAVATSTLMFLAGAVLVYEYARALGWRRETGLAAVLLLCCAPHGFVLSAVYAESTFLCLAAAAALALRRGAWLWAGVFGALLSATRPNGVLFVVFVLAWTVQQHGVRVLFAPWKAAGPMLVLVVAPLGLARVLVVLLPHHGRRVRAANDRDARVVLGDRLALDELHPALRRNVDAPLLGLGKPPLLRRNPAAASRGAVARVRVLPRVLRARLDQRASTVAAALRGSALSDLPGPRAGLRRTAAVARAARERRSRRSNALLAVGFALHWPLAV